MPRTKITDFEWQVLTAASSIPLGETRTYQWVARAIGRPKAVRAVGQALKKNPFLLIVPCHRVIRTDGKLGGYAGAGGIRTKKYLLDLEKEILTHIRKKQNDIVRRREFKVK